MAVMVGRTVGGWDHYSIAALVLDEVSGSQALKTLVRGNCPSTTFELVPGQTMQSCASMCDYKARCVLAGWTAGNCSLSDSIETSSQVNCSYPIAYSFTYKQEVTPVTTVRFLDGDLDRYERGGEISIDFHGAFASHVQLTFRNKTQEWSCVPILGSNQSNCTLVDVEQVYPLCESSNFTLADVIQVENQQDVPVDPRTTIYLSPDTVLDAALGGCFLDVNYVQDKNFRFLLEPDFKENVTQLDFSAVLLKANFGSIVTTVVAPSDVMYRSDTFVLSGEIMDNHLEWTGLTYADTNPNCMFVGGNLLWGFNANFDLDDVSRNPLSFFGVHMMDGDSVVNSTSFKLVSPTQKPVYVFENEGTNEDAYSHWAIFAQTPVGMHTHNVLAKVFYDLGYQPKISNIRFPDADGAGGFVGGCVVWDIAFTNTTCLTHHEIWFRAPNNYMGGAFLGMLGKVNVSTRTFDIPKNTPMPVPENIGVWYVVLKSGFVSKDLESGKVNPREHLEAKLIYTPDQYTGELDWPKSFAIDLTITGRNKNLYNDDLFTYPFPNALQRVEYNQIVNSPLSLEQWFSLLSAGSVHILMTEAMIEHQYLRNVSAPPLAPEEVINFFPVELNPDTNQCIVGAMLNAPLCWTQAHDPNLQYWTTPVPERKIECAVGMDGLRTTLQPLQYLCRYCTMEIHTVADPMTGLPKASTRAACALSEREKCGTRTIDFSQIDVVPDTSTVDVSL
ncbi:unnamed protein product [Amoebophrya sp. A25]|nr:unnamed protein product [Amoebophrya sp. A25]|eukprot:GSA25T00004347001.1